MDREEIIADLNEHYSKQTLITFLKHLGTECNESKNKLELIEILIDGLSSKDKFNVFYNSISKNAQIVLNHLTWEGISSLSYIDSKYNIKISLGDYYDNTADPFIKNLKQYNSKNIMLSNGLRSLLKKYINKPNKIVRELIGEQYSAEEFVLNNINAIIDFIKIQNISQRGIEKSILQKDLQKFKNDFNLGKDILNFQIEYILKFLININSSDDSLLLLKDLFQKYKTGKLFINQNIDHQLFYPKIKGIKTNPTIDIFLKRGRYSFFNYLKSLNCREWINVEECVRELSLLEDTQIFDTTYFGDLLTITLDESKMRNFNKKITLLFKEDNEEFLILPMFNGIVKFLYSFGFAEICIDNKKITHFKLTPLGLYILGFTSDYSVKNNQEFKFKLSSNRLVITTEGQNLSIELFLKRIGKKIGQDAYLINYVEFFKDCSTIDDVEYNIQRFKEMISSKNLKIWSEFYSKITDRISPIYNEQNLLIVNFPRNNRKFIDIITNNKKIRDLFLMVEGFRGAFNQNDYKTFCKIMKEEGFFL